MLDRFKLKWQIERGGLSIEGCLRFAGMLVCMLVLAVGCGSDQIKAVDSPVIATPAIATGSSSVIAGQVYEHYLEDADITIIDIGATTYGIGIRINGSVNFYTEIDKIDFELTVINNTDWILHDDPFQYENMK